MRAICTSTKGQKKQGEVANRRRLHFQALRDASLLYSLLAPTRVADATSRLVHFSVLEFHCSSAVVVELDCVCPNENNCCIVWGLLPVMDEHTFTALLSAQGLKCVGISRNKLNAGTPCVCKCVRVCAFTVMKKCLTHSSAAKVELCSLILFVFLINSRALHYKNKIRLRKCGERRKHPTSFLSQRRTS